MQVTAQNWPYPRWIAHRGAGKLAPENTLAAFRLGAQHGYRMFECDVKLSADGVPFLLHDDTLERTSTGTGIAGEQPWSALARLDAGSWHSRSQAGEPMPTLDNIAAFCQRNGLFLNIEIKPSPGADRLTGEKVADAAARLWQGQAVPPLLTSFSVASLEGAQATQPNLPRGLLLETLWDGWLQTAQRLGCIAIVCDHTLWTAETVAQVKAAGLRSASYTVNDAASAQRLAVLGTDGVITDRIDLFAPAV
ncbi:MAG: glycerophosphodiester phosphodiesterase [Rhodoferax sp.]|uniref:glycerophosphodiester phosphodiesterase n=1 Tax=Rhodoferax sp. TaxID=50421 RepID=UPI0032630D48